MIAMVGKDCVAIASDLRLGNQSLGISSNFQRVPPNLFLCVYAVHPAVDFLCDGSHLYRLAWPCNRCDNSVSSIHCQSRHDSVYHNVAENDFALG